eukprot:Awhi_evm1s8603
MFIELNYRPRAGTDKRLLTFYKPGRLVCKEAKVENTVFSNIVNLEACLRAAAPETDPVVNYDLKRGTCELLTCQNDEYKWQEMNSPGVYSYARSETENPI